MFHTLQNEFLTVTISSHGAELQSVRSAAGTEFLWQGDPAVWSGRAPVMFPICGGLKDDRYTLEGQSHILTKHGFAKLEEFTLAEGDDRHAVFALRENPRTLPSFPFRFTFTVSFLLEGRTLRVCYAVENRDDRTLYCNVGAHEAYAAPEGIREYAVEFEKPETLSATVLHGNLLGEEIVPVLQNARILPLTPDFFQVDALVFPTLSSRRVTLRHVPTGRAVTVDFEDFEHLLLWQKHDARYLCVEPWDGLPDYEDADGDLSHKKSIRAVPAGENLARTHTITFAE